VGSPGRAATGCICNAGYSGQFSHSCTACEAGKYKDTNANMNCNLCAPGSFSTAIIVVYVVYM
jgi:hypothetical protein